MAAEKEETQKLFYTIGEVSEMFELNASTLRFWEKEFDFLRPSKNKKGNRTFTQKDIDNIARIVDLVKQKGFTIQGAKEQLKGGSASTARSSGNNAEVIAKLEKIKDKLIDLGDQL
ncbi:MAG: MerR family transcriptional regulator [Bacteroidetes bacterium]|nr:MerR family transcriptional regulator [Bacteroidota bacterium]